MASKAPVAYPAGIINRLWDLYCESPKRFHIARRGSIYMPKNGTNPRPLQRGHLAGHLAGHYALCVFGREGASRYVCFDVDHGGWELVRRVLSELKAVGFDEGRIYPSTSGNKGYHIEMFFTAPIEYALIRRLYQDLLHRTGATTRDMELRPSDKRSIKIPLGRHQKTGNRCWYIDPTTEKEIHDLRFVFRIRRMDTAHAKECMANCKREVERPDIIKPRAQMDLTDLPRVTQPKTRHDLMVSITGAIEARGYSLNECRNVLSSWYSRQDKELIHTDEKRVMRDIDKMTEWAYRNGHRTRAKVVIFPADVRRIVGIRSMVERAIYFHVLVWERAKNEDRTTQRYLANILGVSDLSITKAIAGLKRRGLIETKNGKKHKDAHGYYMDKTSVVTAGEVELAAADAKTALVVPTQLKDDFWKIYFDTMFSVADADWLMSKLCKREREKLTEIEQRSTE